MHNHADKPWWDTEQELECPDDDDRTLVARTATLWRLDHLEGAGYRLALHAAQIEDHDLVPRLSLWPWSGHFPAISLTPDEARELANALTHGVEIVENIIALAVTDITDEHHDR